MKKNHFFFSYFGNKRLEVEDIYNSIKDKLNDIEYIVEPFCGSSALSYYISLQHPKKFKYILNDNNYLLIELYKTAQDTKQYETLINELIKLKQKTKNKDDYLKVCQKSKVDLNSYIFVNKIYSIRPGLFPNDKYDNNNFMSLEKMKDLAILNFIKNEDILFRSDDANAVYKEFKGNSKALIFLDPPYLLSNNNWYKCPNVNIYEYFVDNDIVNEKAQIVLCLENIWIIKLLFKNKKNIIYEKVYQTTKKKTEHIIILNK